MRVLITGGTGFIGRHVCAALLSREDQVVVLSRSLTGGELDSRVQRVTQLSQIEGNVDAVINLAGAPIVDKRWTDQRKQLLRASRIDTTRSLNAWMADLENKPSVMVSGSAVGFYGSQDEKLLGENAEPKAGFSHQLCADWESEAMLAEKLGVRVCVIRTGIVLGDGGALSKMLLPFKLGLGGPIADGHQWMSWIHIQDEVAAILWLLDHPVLEGAFNLTAPRPVSNDAFSKSLGRALGRPAFFRMPGFVMEMMLGEASELLIEGQRVIPEKLLASGFSFRFDELDDALADLLKG
ncbi:TIGR01777 family oxidoreductase [Nitrincola alkalilacustris]|uniref:TIGR01777 family oxidoreductase n=1 Tax=Nitrincola alkalilacustris TaxID=1571224 RepID=UPI00124D0A48|nr:TIGR01777 family oxidoreductase [Nitrincola alkalilacustris]